MEFEKFDKLRRTQIIFNSGPGAIVDLSYSAIISGLEEWKNIDKLEEISFPNRRGFRRLVRPPIVRRHPFSKRPITPMGTVPSFRFPDWVQCTDARCNAFGPIWKVAGTRPDKCVCGGAFVPARIIKICADGHMDDYPWDQFYHEERECEIPHPKFQLASAERQSGSLNDLILFCKCGQHPSGKALGSIYEFPLGRYCGGRKPWLSSNDAKCEKRSEVVLRGASNVYFPKVMSELIVPKAKTKIELFYSEYVTQYKSAYFLMPATSRGDLLNGILDRQQAEVSRIGIERSELFNELTSLLSDVDKHKKEFVSEEKIREDEYEILNNPSIVNPDTVPKVYDAKRIAVDPLLDRKGLGNLVCVKRLQEIRVLQGFSRVLPHPKKDKGRIIDLGESTDGTYLAIEINGEGIFLSFDNKRLLKWASSKVVRERGIQLGKYFSEQGLRPIPFTVDARAIFLHSFSHALIKQMALFGGYSSVAIREKLYLGPDHNGILIYTGDSDSEGTMGGITSLAEKDKFSEIFQEAIEDCRWCSSDPICAENSPDESNSENLAACHACLFLSETSCEFSNKFLDRSLVVSSNGLGFFDE